jgi:flagellar hook assembly protein FlgD
VTAGRWYGISFRSADQSQLSYVTVEGAGINSTLLTAAIKVFAGTHLFNGLLLRTNANNALAIVGGTLTVTNSTITGTTGGPAYGIDVQGGTVSVSFSTISNNNTAMRVLPGAIASFTNNSLIANTVGLSTSVFGTPPLATLNYWGASSGPSGIGPGTGQSIVGIASFDPWLIAAPSQQEYMSSALYAGRRFNPSTSERAGWTLAAFQTGTWQLVVRNTSGTPVRSLTTAGPNAGFVWDGKNDGGVLQSDGRYTYSLDLTSNGGAAATTASGRIFLDNSFLVSITSPEATQTLSNFYQNGVSDVPFTGSVMMADLSSWYIEYGSGTAPLSFTTIASGTTSIASGVLGTWATGLVPNGPYTARLRAADSQGDLVVRTINPVVANISVSQDVIQANPSTAQYVTYTSVLPFQLSQTLVVKNETGAIVRTLVASQNRAPGSYVDVWNGRTDSGVLVPDGAYFHVGFFSAGSTTMTWDLSTQYRNDWSAYADDTGITISSTFDPFNNKPVFITYTFPQAGRVSMGLSNAGGPGPACVFPPEICPMINKYEEAGTHTYTWAGVDSNGIFHGDMRSVGVVSQRYAFSKNAVVIFGTKPVVSNVTVTPPLFAPYFNTQTIAFDLSTYQSGTADIVITIQNQASLSTLRTLSLAAQTAGHKTAAWDGRADNGMLVAAGYYTVTVNATDTIGNKVSGQILTTVEY